MSLKKSLLFMVLSAISFCCTQELPNKEPNSLPKVLNSIYYRDQHYRKIQIEYYQNKNWDDEVLKDLEILIEHYDSLNRLYISKLLMKNGWPKKNNISYQGHKTIFLVIQHSDYDFQKKHFPYLRDAYTNGIIEGRQMALIIDRMSLHENGFQYYGTQLKLNDSSKLLSLSPLKDSSIVDSLRMAMGLDSLHEYLLLWNIHDINHKNSDQLKTISLEANSEKPIE